MYQTMCIRSQYLLRTLDRQYSKSRALAAIEFYGICANTSHSHKKLDSWAKKCIFLQYSNKFKKDTFLMKNEDDIKTMLEYRTSIFI